MGLAVEAIQPVKSKEQRLIGASHLIENGSLLLPRNAPWVSDFEIELLNFPNTKYSDRVDALSQALQWFSERLRSSDFYYEIGW